MQRGGLFGFSNEEQLIKHLETAVIENGKVKFDSVEKHFDFCEKMIDLLYEWSKDPTYHLNHVLYEIMRNKEMTVDVDKNIFTIPDDKIDEIIKGKNDEMTIDKQLCVRLSRHIRHIQKIVMGKYYNDMMKRCYTNPDEKTMDALFCKDITNKMFKSLVAPPNDERFMIDRTKNTDEDKDKICSKIYHKTAVKITINNYFSSHGSINRYQRIQEKYNTYLDKLSKELLIHYNNKLIDKLEANYNKNIPIVVPMKKKEIYFFVDFVKTDEFNKITNIYNSFLLLSLFKDKFPNKVCKGIYINYQMPSVLFLSQDVSKENIDEFKKYTQLTIPKTVAV